jgi:2-phosphosulfolactate phosphatase
MMSSPWGQDGSRLRLEWGLTGSREVSSGRGVLVVVDALSFTTVVTVANERGGVVYPASWRDERAGELAAKVDAPLAVGRSEVPKNHPLVIVACGAVGRASPRRTCSPLPERVTTATGRGMGGTWVRDVW